MVFEILRERENNSELWLREKDREKERRKMSSKTKWSLSHRMRTREAETDWGTSPTKLARKEWDLMMMMFWQRVKLWLRNGRLGSASKDDSFFTERNNAMVPSQSVHYCKNLGHRHIYLKRQLIIHTKIFFEIESLSQLTFLQEDRYHQNSMATTIS